MNSTTSLSIEPSLKKRLPDLEVVVGRIENVTVRASTPELEALKREIAEQARRMYSLDSIKDNPTFRAYRDFFWKIKVDPTKIRPAAEALVRRVVGGKPLPRINSLVDAYNLASIKTEVALAALDAGKLHGNLLMRFASEGEEFLGIGMKKPVKLTGGEVVVSDDEKLVAIYPYRDADASKVTEETRNVLILVCGVPGINEDKLRSAMTVTFDFITRFCEGTVKST